MDTEGNLVPANPDGTSTPLEHLYGMDPAKGNSPYSSFMTEEGGVAKTYGAQEIEVDIVRLNADIEAGKVPGVEIVHPDEIKVMMRTEIEEIASVDYDAAFKNGSPGIEEYVDTLGLSRGKSAAVARRLRALYNTQRDGEYLIKGIIPGDYLRGPYPAPWTRP